MYFVVTPFFVQNYNIENNTCCFAACVTFRLGDSRGPIYALGSLYPGTNGQEEESRDHLKKRAVGRKETWNLGDPSGHLRYLSGLWDCECRVGNSELRRGENEYVYISSVSLKSQP